MASSSENDIITVRPATLRDYDAIVAVSEGVYDGNDYLVTHYHQFYHNPNSNMFVAEHKGKVVCSRWKQCKCISVSYIHKQNTVSNV